MSWQFLQKLGVCDTDVARGCQSFGQIFYIFSCRTSLGHPLFTQPPDFLLSLFPGGEGFIEGAAEGGVQIELVQGKWFALSIVQTSQFRRNKVARGVVKSENKADANIRT